MNSNVYDKQKGEPQFWYGRFETYRLLGTERTIEDAWRTKCPEVAKRRKRPGSAWYVASKTWDWIKRAEAWDASEKARVDKEWELRRVALKDADYELGQKMRTLAARLISMMPNFLDSKESFEPDPRNPGQSMRVLTLKMRTRPSDAAQMAKVASELQRLAAGMSSENVDVTSGGEKVGVIVYLPDNGRDAKRD
jgi:hypothetical protein